MKTKHYQVERRLINEGPAEDLGIVVVLPAYDESDVLSVLESLSSCTFPKALSIEVIIVFNASEKDGLSVKDTNALGYYKVKEWILSRDGLRFNIYPMLMNDLPSKTAGVGLARKIGMDEAWRRLMSTGQSNGLIVNLDMDCKVESNYFTALNEWRLSALDKEAASIYFEHPLPSGDHKVEAIVSYELHLRYFIEMQRWLGLPYAFHTIGSSMVVRAEAYGIVGGMNKRKAGEDFYFLHKLIKRDRFDDITETCVYPAARISERVPFGTGKAIKDHLDHKRYAHTYSPKTFEVLSEAIVDVQQKLLSGIDDFYDMDKEWERPVRQFFDLTDIRSKWVEIFRHASTPEARLKRFFLWFDAFMLMKYCHYCRDADVSYSSSVKDAAMYLLRQLDYNTDEDLDTMDMLNILRQHQRAR